MKRIFSAWVGRITIAAVFAGAIALIVIYKSSSTESIATPLPVHTAASIAAETQVCPDKFPAEMDGLYAKELIWEQLPLTRHWFKVTKQHHGEFGDVFLDSKATGGNSNIGATFWWHEGANPCIEFRRGALWAGFRTDSGLLWDGPYIRVGTDIDKRVAYFNRLFGAHCYVDNDGIKWCFGDAHILVGDRRVSASLHLDSSESPTYGNVVKIEGEDKLWVFVPVKDGWKVFKDTWYGESRVVDIDPDSTPAWRSLSSIQSSAQVIPMDSAASAPRTEPAASQ